MLIVANKRVGSLYVIEDDEVDYLPEELRGTYTHLSTAKAAIDSYLRTTAKAKGVTKNAKRSLAI